MADLTITAANVVPDASATLQRGGLAGGTITAGMPIYKDAADADKLKGCDADAEASAACVGIAVNGASDNQPVDYITEGILTIGATVTVGTSYFVTPNAGGLGAIAEVLAADYVSLVCLGISTTQVYVQPIVSGAVKV